MPDEVADLRSLSTASGALWSSLRQAFQAAAYFDGVLDEAEDIVAGKPEPVRAPLVRWGLLDKRRPDATLAALFVYAGAVERRLIDEALGAGLVTALLEHGLLRADGERLTSDLRVIPFDGVWIMSDELWRAGDPVMGPSLTTDVLRRALPPVEGRAVLDVGCGAGSLAVWAAARGARATGVDISPRAIELARLNALLNGVACDLLVGDLTQPVAGQRFDLVVSQPPFLMQPPDLDRVTYLHGGPAGVELTFRLFSELEGVLAPGGRALVMFDAAVESTPLVRRIMAAVDPREPLGLVASVGGYLGPDAVAWLTALAGSRHADDEYAARATRYRAHLAAREITRVAHVLADLRRLPPGQASFAATVSWDRLPGLDPARLETAWNNVRLLGLGPEALLTTPLRLADGARLRVDQPAAGEGDPSFTLSFSGGFIQDQEVDEASVAVLRALEAHGTIEAACQELAAPGSAPDELHGPVSDLVRHLLLHGALHSV